MTAFDVATATALLAALGILIEAIELIGARHSISQLFTMKAVRPFLSKPFMKRAAGLLKQPGPFSLLIGLRALAALATVYFFAHQMALAILSTAAVVALGYLKQYRLPLGSSGAEMMQRVIWISLFLFACTQGSIAGTAALGFIAFQGLTSYFTAGLSKLKVQSWRDGTAVGQVVGTQVYGTSFTMTLPYAWISPFLTYSTLVFEIVGPFLVFLSPTAALIFFGMGLSFHISIAIVSGLTDFVFAFSATYPAIYWIVIQAPLWF